MRGDFLSIERNNIFAGAKSTVHQYCREHNFAFSINNAVHYRHRRRSSASKPRLNLTFANPFNSLHRARRFHKGREVAKKAEEGKQGAGVIFSWPPALFSLLSFSRIVVDDTRPAKRAYPSFEQEEEKLSSVVRRRLEQRSPCSREVSHSSFERADINRCTLFITICHKLFYLLHLGKFDQTL